MMCPDETRLIKFMADELPPAERELIVQHLPRCSDCRGRLAEMQAVYTGLGDWEVVPPPRDLSAAILARAATGTRWWGWQRMAAAVLLAVGAGVAAGVLTPVSAPVRQVHAEPPVQALGEAWGLDALGAPAVGVAGMLASSDDTELEDAL
jgi:anti-sigma factor RsiW